MIDALANLRLEVETPPPTGKSKNLIRNPDGELGGFFYLTPTGGGMSSSITTAGWVRYSHATGATGFTTEGMSVTPGQYVSARWRGFATTGTITLTARIDFENTAGAVIGTSGTSPAYTTAPTTERTFGPFLAPAGTATARVVWTPGSIIPGQVIELADVGFVARSSSAAVVWASDVAYGPTWVNILGPTVEMEWERVDLDLGLLSATIRDATLDPATATTIRPGRACRVTVRHGVTGTWETMFEGEVTDFDVDYDARVLARKPGDPKHCRITLDAADRTRTLASVRRPYGLAPIYMARETLEGAGVPWKINGSTAHSAGTPTIVSYNENATALDQVALTRDSLAAHAWLDRRGVLNLIERTRMVPFTNGGFEADTAQWTPSGATLARVTTPVATGTGSGSLTATGTASITTRTTTTPIIPGHPYAVSIKSRAATVARSVRVDLEWRDANNGNAGITQGATTTNAVGAWTTHSVSLAANLIPRDAVSVRAAVWVFSPGGAGEVHYLDDLDGLAVAVVLDEATWTNIDVGGGSRSCINEVTVDYLRYVPAAGTVTIDYTPEKSEVIPYGPYRDEASIAEFGVRPKKFTIQGTNEAAEVPAFAAQVLAANAFPKVSAKSVRLPVKSANDLVMTRALGDLQQTALVSFASKGYAEPLRIVGLRHTIKADAKHKARWLVDYTFDAVSTVAAPRAIPAPPRVGPTYRPGLDAYPVGAIYMSTVATSPATLFGGTWATLPGRFLVGVDPAQAEFDTAGETGGAKSVTLTAAQSGTPVHGHGVSDPGHAHGLQNGGAPLANGGGTPANLTTGGGGYVMTGIAAAGTGLTVQNHPGAPASAAHENLPPYLAVHMWKRTA